MATPDDYTSSVPVSRRSRRGRYISVSSTSGLSNGVTVLCVDDLRTRSYLNDLVDMVEGYEKKDGRRLSVNDGVRCLRLPANGQQPLVLPAWVPGDQQRLYTSLFYSSNLEFRRVKRENTVLQKLTNRGKLRHDSGSTRRSRSRCARIRSVHRPDVDPSLSSKSETRNRAAR